MPQPYTAFKRDSRLPSYCASKLRVHAEFLSGFDPVCKVSHKGNLLLCKSAGKGLQSEDLRKEIGHLHKILDEARNHRYISVPIIRGYVTHARSGAVIGFVSEWVQPSPRGLNLDSINVSKVPCKTRQQWGDQIEYAVASLHEIGIIWGDCKPANIVVDEEDDVYLINLGGRFSMDWVSKEITGTLEGDAVGVAKILKYLGLEYDTTKVM